MKMVSSNLNTGKELAKIRNEYKAAVAKFESHGTPVYRTLSEERLVSMQSMLYSILIAIGGSATEETQKQSNEATYLFNMISADLKNLQLDRRAASFY